MCFAAENGVNSNQDISKVILSQEFWIEIKNDL